MLDDKDPTGVCAKAASTLIVLGEPTEKPLCPSHEPGRRPGSRGLESWLDIDDSPRRRGPRPPRPGERRPALPAMIDKKDPRTFLLLAVLVSDLAPEKAEPLVPPLCQILLNKNSPYRDPEDKYGQDDSLILNCLQDLGRAGSNGSSDAGRASKGATRTEGRSAVKNCRNPRRDGAGSARRDSDVAPLP